MPLQIEQKRIPLRPLFIENPMPTFFAPNGVTLLQLNLRRALAAQILSDRLEGICGEIRCAAGVEIGGGGWGDIGFALSLRHFE